MAYGMPAIDAICYCSLQPRNGFRAPQSKQKGKSMIQRLIAVLLLAVCCLAQNADRKEITVSPGILARYVGVYAMAPTVYMTITLADGQLTSQMTGQGKVPLYDESETLFFPRNIKAEIEFPKDATGPASQLILHQNGRDMTAKRLDDAAAKKV